MMGGTLRQDQTQGQAAYFSIMRQVRVFFGKVVPGLVAGSGKNATTFAREFSASRQSPFQWHTSGHF